MAPGNDKYRLLMENLPDAFAYHKIVTDSEGEPVDYIFLDVNPAFEKMTGLSRYEILNKRVREIMPELKNSSFDWIGAYGKVALTGENASFESYSEQLKRWYKVTAYSDEPGYFAAIFSDITAQKKLVKAEASLEENKPRLKQDITDRKRAEEELIKQEALLQKIFDLLPVGLWFADKKGALLRGNPEGIRIWGAEPQVGQNEYGVFKAKRLPSGEEVAPHDWALAHSINKGVTVADEMLEIEDFNGQKKIILNYTAPVVDDKGMIQGAIVVNQDITDRKVAEQKLRESEYKLNQILSNMMEVFWLRSADNKEMLYISPSYEKVWGRTCQSIYENPDTFMESVLDEYKPLVATEFERYKKKGLFELEYPIARPDGSVRWVWARSFPVKDGHGNIIHHTGIAVDITERIEAEQTLKESETRNKALLDAIPDYMFVFNREGEFLDYKANGSLLLPPEEFMYKKASQVLPPHLARLTLDRLKKVFKTGQIEQYEYQEEITNELRHFESRLVPCGEDKALAIVRDITDRKQAEGRFQALVENMPVMVDAFDEIGLILFWNKECERLTGYSAEEIVGNSDALESLYPDKEYREKILREIERRGFDWRELELDVTCKDGSVKTIAFSNISSKVSIPGWHTWAIGVDITERKQAEEALRRREEEFRALAENSPDMVVRFDKDLRHLYVNPALEKEVGIPRQEFIGRTNEDFDIPAKHLMFRNRTLKEVFNSGQEKEVYFNYTLSSRQKHYHARVVPEFASDGTVETVLAITRDITSIKEMEAA
ncbi:PAS domain S-box protein, partial [Methanosalsum natronophilum]